MSDSPPSPVHVFETKQAANTRWPLFALAMGAFGIGTSEFMPMGLLPTIARGLNVSIPAAGLLVSAYAIGVMVGAPFVTLALGKLRPRRALIVLMGIFTLGNLLSALAPGYNALLLARIFTSLSHGSFFGLGVIVAASIVPKDRQASAVAGMLMGLTIANIGGVPAATWLGQHIGWRIAFVGAAGLGLISMAVLRLALPYGEMGKLPALGHELRVLTRPRVLLVISTTILSAGAMFTLYTYIAPVLVHLTGASEGFVTLALILIGIGFTIGNAIGGRLADRSLEGTTKAVLLVLAAMMFALPIILSTKVGAALGLLAWGAATFAVMPSLQMRVMRAASEAPGLASSINIGAFNIGNALGALVGGGVISLHLGYQAVPFAGGILALFAWAVVFSGREPQVTSERLARTSSLI